MARDFSKCGGSSSLLFSWRSLATLFFALLRLFFLSWFLHGFLLHQQIGVLQSYLLILFSMFIASLLLSFPKPFALSVVFVTFCLSHRSWLRCLLTVRSFRCTRPLAACRGRSTGTLKRFLSQLYVWGGYLNLQGATLMVGGNAQHDTFFTPRLQLVFLPHINDRSEWVQLPKRRMLAVPHFLRRDPVRI